MEEQTEPADHARLGLQPAQRTEPSTYDELSSAPSIQDYELSGFLGEGSTAHVYLATHTRTGEQVAVKVIDKLYVRQAMMEHKVQREILLHAALDHANVVEVKETFDDARNHYLVLEYCAGGSVASLLRSMRGEARLPIPVDEATAKSIFKQTAQGVAYLHSRGIIHRDLKLANLLLTLDSVVKISDFGLATLVTDEHRTVCGTPNFIAPEVLQANDAASLVMYDESVDIWSLGCILYTLLLGKPPFEGAKVSDTLANVVSAARRSLQFPKGFSAAAGDLIKRMLNSDPGARPTISQVLAHVWLRPPQQIEKVDDSTDDDNDPVLAWSQRSLSRSFRASSSKSRPFSTSARLSRSNGPSSKRQQAVKHRTRGYSSDDSSFVERDDDASLSSLDMDELELSSASSSSSDDDEEAASGEIEQPTRQSPVEEEKSAVSRLSKLEPPVEEHSQAAQDVHVARVPVTDVHFLRLRIEVSDLPFLKISADMKRELFWDVWESSDIRQLTRFTLTVGDCELEYVPAKAVLRGRMAEGTPIHHRFSGESGSSVAVPNEDVQRVVQLCQCLASRSLQLRRAAMAVDIDQLPITHFDAIPESLLSSLRRTSVRDSVLQELHRFPRDTADQGDTSLLSCSLPGVGICELDSDGRLLIQFYSGQSIRVNSTGSMIHYRRSPGEDDHEFDLESTPFLPGEVKKYFEFIPAFVRQLKVPTKAG